MNVFSCLNGRFYILITVAASVLAGCSVLSPGEIDSFGVIPLSNSHVAETVIKRAFKDLDIPHGRGMKVSWLVEGTGYADEHARVIAPEFLFSRGFRISGKDGSIPEIRFIIDTLYVRLNVERSKQEGKRISRFAEACVDAVYSEEDSTRKFYNGRGVFYDFFPVSMLDTVGKNEPYVIRSNSFITALKPILYGLAITSFLWLLYYYRG